ncbi:MAG TPA: glycosyltransferase, partial [Mycobacteriales bacterium]|nr:glycosyltransferase [Mycobacteriales bacterium]
MRVGLDGTPLLGSPTGVGRYTAGLAAGLATLPDGPTVRLVPFSWRGATELAAAAAAQLGPVAGSARVETTARRVPARALRALWMHAGLPPVEWLAGAIEVFHGTNYLLPPTRRAAGVVTIHDLTYLHHPEWVNAASRAYRELVPVALRRAAVVTTVSATVRDELLEAYPRLDPDRVLVTPNGVEPAAVERASVAPAPGAALPRPAGLPADYLLFLGTVEPRKGLDTVLEAYRSSSTTLPPLVVAGAAGWGGPSQGAEDAGAGGQVIRLGYVDA